MTRLAQVRALYREQEEESDDCVCQHFELGSDTDEDLEPPEADVPWPMKLAVDLREMEVMEAPPIDTPPAFMAGAGMQKMQPVTDAELEAPPIDTPPAFMAGAGMEEMQPVTDAELEAPGQAAGTLEPGVRHQNAPEGEQEAPRGAAAADKGPRLGMNRPLREIAPGATTLCVRNVPSRYTHEQLLREWKAWASFDFLYHPFGFVRKRSLGYVVINFVSPEAAIAFQLQWHGKRLSDHGPTRALDIATGEVQGYRALLANFAAKILATKNKNVLPVLLAGGRFLDAHGEAREALALQCQ